MFTLIVTSIALVSITGMSIIMLNKIMNPVLLINSYYLIWIIIGRLGYLGQYLPSIDSTLFITLNILCLDIAVIVGCNVKFKIKKINNGMRLSISHILKFIRVASFIISLIIFLNILRLIISGGLSVDMIRFVTYNIDNSNIYLEFYINQTIYRVYHYIIRGFVFFDITYSLVCFYKKSVKINWMTITNSILFIFIMQSRIEMLKILVFAIVSLVLSGIELTRNQKRIIKRIIIVVIPIIILVLSWRSITMEKNTLLNSFDSFIIDYSGSNYAFSVYFDRYIQGMRLDDPPFMIVYLGGLGVLIEYILGLFGCVFQHGVDIYCGNLIYIGPSIEYNAFYTMYCQLLNGGGFLGCIMFLFILGFVIGYLYNGIKYKSTKRLYLLTFFICVVLMGTFTFGFYYSYASLVIMLCTLLCQNYEIKKELL